ncbi:sodium/potassium-transporting ATPase subunit beta-3-like [Clarias magur]|uniref:Sodium/potassium-transporting ATPase subunit beta n=2 Tax=Clarias magur TaxID=1594786 RepID=A0A8J4XDB4_CLAMG|nr:sodium/potassium-transporting ATPase subunit beta-3-like [Clarias magur]
MANKEEKAEGKESSWKDFIYNPRTGEFLGRTASSWALIFLFYLVFYGFLAGMFTLTMWVMLQTLDDYTPRYRDRVANPGLMIRPSELELEVNRSNPQQYSKYVNELESFLKDYNDALQEENEQCPGGKYYEQDDIENIKVCQFKRSKLRQCSGLADPDFGYAEGQPCVLLKLNRIIGLMPLGEPYINCTAKRDTLLQMQYFPSGGQIDKMYFPYYGKKAHCCAACCV